MCKETILIVDNESIELDLMREILSEYYCIKIATDVHKALEILDNRLVDLLLLNLSISQMDNEILRQMQNPRQNVTIPLIFLGIQDDTALSIKGFEAGAVDYISKPFNKEELLMRVSNHLKSLECYKNVQEQKSFIQTILDAQSNMMVISDGTTPEFVNQRLLDFYNCQNIDAFVQKYSCIATTFIHHDNYFHEGKVEGDMNWIEQLKRLHDDKQIVSIVSQTHFRTKAFKLSITPYKTNRYIITLSEMSATMMQQLEGKNEMIHDKLTHAYNRDYFERHYEEYIIESSESGEYFGIALIDIDHFKKVNDNYGYDVGDSVLKEFVSTLNQFSRKNDIVIRWGGEEFVIMMKVGSKFALARALEHYRKVISHHDFENVGHITCSIGGAFYNHGESIEQSIQRADRELFKAKESGRNMVFVTSD